MAHLAPNQNGDPRATSEGILIELEDPPRLDLFDLVNLEYDLSDLLGVRVDLAIRKNLRKRIGQRILSEVVPL